jgi:hypothetical protein
MPSEGLENPDGSTKFINLITAPHEIRVVELENQRSATLSNEQTCRHDHHP